jgi:hypothetical protein
MSFFIRPIDAPGFRFRPAGVETHALADERQKRAVAAPGHVDQARVLVAGAAHGVDQRQVRVQKAFAMGAGDRRAVQLGQVVDSMFQGPRAHILGGRVDQVAGQRLARGDPFQARGVEMGWRHQAGLRRRLAAIARETVEREQVAERDFGSRPVIGPGLDLVGGLRQFRDGRADGEARARAVDASPVPRRHQAGRPSARRESRRSDRGHP